MRKLLFLLIFIFAGCTKIDILPPKVELGAIPTSSVINKVSPIVSDGSNVVVYMALTTDAKYSLQVTDLLDNELKVFGFTAESSKVTKRIDLSDLKNGDYNLVLIDIQGREYKTHVIIKK
jgi:hypothetical protein